VLKSIAFNYETQEDRVLAVINPGQPDAWSGWLTRRPVLALLERAAKFLASTSALVRRAPTDIGREVVAFERDVAMAATAKALTPTPTDVFKSSATVAELAQQLTVSRQGDNFRVVLHGKSGGGAAGVLARAELQRILQMLQAEVAKAGWSGTPAASPTASATEETGPKPVRH
jgi:hypothetical protein